MKSALLALPRLARMIAALLGDRDVPAAARVALAAMAVYLASPVDLVPDVIPVLGLLDDLVVAAIVVDGLLSYVDRARLLRYWPWHPSTLDQVATVARRLASWVPGRLQQRLFGPRPPGARHPRG